MNATCPGISVATFQFGTRYVPRFEHDQVADTLLVPVALVGMVAACYFLRYMVPCLLSHIEGLEKKSLRFGVVKRKPYNRGVKGI